MNTSYRYVGCLLCCALGDGLGAQTADAAHPESVPLAIDPHLEWTEPTHHALYTALALLEAGTGDAEALGRAMTHQWGAWYHDRSLLARRPREASLKAAVDLLRGEDWHTVGDPEDDGAGVLVRAVPVGLAHTPDEAVERAMVVAGITQAHPDALQGSVVVAWLCASLVRGEALDRGLVVQALEVGRHAVPGAGAVEGAEAALEAVASGGRAAAALDPGTIPPGDGGRSVSSALGLALLYVLSAGHDWPPAERALELAARVPGDSAVVAALVGAILGAAWGMDALPLHLLERTERHDALMAVADALHQRAIGQGFEVPRLHRDQWSRRLPTVEDGTDREWTDTELPRALHEGENNREPTAPGAPAAEWIRLAAEDVDQMREQDAYLLADVVRRW